MWEIAENIVIKNNVSAATFEHRVNNARNLKGIYF